MPSHSSGQRVRRERRQDVALWFDIYKANLRCVRCGYRDYRALEFHHRDPATKRAAVADLVKDGRSEKEILAEVAKCDVLCANCHRLKHHRGAPPVPGCRLGRLPKTGRVPRLCCHRSSGRAYATDPRTRREVYFGLAGTQAAEDKYWAWAVAFMPPGKGRKMIPPSEESQLFGRARRLLRVVAGRGHLTPRLLASVKLLSSQLEAMHGRNNGKTTEDNPVPLPA